ncbi:MAG: hypothetical protein IPK07_31760 [Deltaproteobacteria bacterium]|nr:hypothetical protein [Deltaproteobacteria bacterium]
MRMAKTGAKAFGSHDQVRGAVGMGIWADGEKELMALLAVVPVLGRGVVLSVTFNRDPEEAHPIASASSALDALATTLVG